MIWVFLLLAIVLVLTLWVIGGLLIPISEYYKHRLAMEKPGPLYAGHVCQSPPEPEKPGAQQQPMPYRGEESER
jgi:hypothetical protein